MAVERGDDRPPEGKEAEALAWLAAACTRRRQDGAWGVLELHLFWEAGAITGYRLREDTTRK